MVTEIRKGARPHLYVKEWIDAQGLSNEKVALRIGVSRETVWRWADDQERLTPQKINSLAEALAIEPEDFWRPPGRRSIDAALKDASEEDHNAVLDFVARVIRRTG